MLYQYNRFVKPSYDEYIKPTMRYANIIVPFGSDNTTAIDFIVTNLRSKLAEIQHSAKRKFNPVTQEDEVVMVAVQKALGFEIVDYTIDYIGFKDKVRYLLSNNMCYSFFKAGNKENYKLEIMIRQLINSESPEIVEYFSFYD